MINNEVPVYFSRKFEKKINWLVKNYPLEIAGFITGEWTDYGIEIDDVLIFPQQRVSSGEVVKDASADPILVKEHGVEVTNKIIGEWHSHNTMRSFWSPTDEGFIKSFLTNEDGQNIKDFCLCVVSSYHEKEKDPYEHLVRLDINGVKGIKATFDKLDYYVYPEENTAIVTGKQRINRNL